MAQSIPIRVIPGNTELVKDTTTPNGDYHLNVGFHISFNVKDLMAALVQMTDGEVTIQAGASMPLPKGGKGAAAPAEPPRAPMENLLGGPLKNTIKPEATVSGMSWETPLTNLSTATQEYRKKPENIYAKSSAKFLLAQ
jgi:hypothetical protein